MTELTNNELELLREMANEGESWSDAVQAYLDALEEVGEIEPKQS